MTENNFNFTNGVSYDVWCEQKRLIDKLKDENARYRKALEEIERIATTFRARESSYHNVLDIINKAKEKENATGYSYSI